MKLVWVSRSGEFLFDDAGGGREGGRIRREGEEGINLSAQRATIVATVIVMMRY